jgi:hypothetical protein
MEAPQTLYGQGATHLVLRLFLRADTNVGGALVVDIAHTFLSTLVLPGCRLTSLDTKRPGIGPKLNMGEFSDRRWQAAVKKILADDYAVIGVKAQTPASPKEQIWLSIHVNPPGTEEGRVSGTVEVMMSVSYLRRLVAWPEKVEALVQLGSKAWNGIDGGPAYGYANLAMSPPRAMFPEWSKQGPGAPLPWHSIKAPAERAHAVPVAAVGDVDLNLASLYCSGRGIKGAFWANYLTPAHVTQAGGEPHLRATLAGLRMESLAHGGLLVVATDSPLPEDTQDTRDRFLRLHAALQPAFLSREATSANKREMLGYFYRERPAIIP